MRISLMRYALALRNSRLLGGSGKAISSSLSTSSLSVVMLMSLKFKIALGVSAISSKSDLQKYETKNATTTIFKGSETNMSINVEITMEISHSSLISLPHCKL